MDRLSPNDLLAEELLQLVEHFGFEVEIAHRQHLDLRRRALRVPPNPLAGALRLALALGAGARGQGEEIGEAMRSDAEERLEADGVRVSAVVVSALRRAGVVVSEDRVAVQLERTALRVRLDVHHTAETGGDDEARALMTGERRREERRVARARADARGGEHRLHLRVTGAPELEEAHHAGALECLARVVEPRLRLVVQPS